MRIGWLVGAIAALAIGGCASSKGGTCDPTVSDCACSVAEDCPAGYACVFDICQPSGDGGAGADGSAGIDSGPTIDAIPPVDAKPKVGFGEPCTDKSDCQSNICILVGIGGICSETCVGGSCPQGYGCVGVFGAIEPGQVADVCVPESNQLCTTCTMDSECSLIGTDKCIEYEPGKSFCGRDCSSIGCPSGYSCEQVVVNAIAYDQCVPTSGSCECDASNMGATQGCSITTPFGTCAGERVCLGATGWGTCDPPSSTDTPDGTFTDDNCDGIDGDIDGGIFVSEVSGNDTASCGLTYMDPCATINKGIVRAVEASRGEVYVQRGTYNEVVVMINGIDIYGGYDLMWQRDVHTLNSHKVTIVGARDTGTGGDGEYLTIRAHNLIVNTIIADLTIEGPNAAGTVSRRGRSSYAVHADSALLTLQRVTIVAGNGAPGSGGSTGQPTSSPARGGSMNGLQGGGADEFATACNTTSHGAGGARGTNSCSSGRNPNGGNGGNGGEMDTSCFLGVCDNCNATAGDAGGNAGYTNGTYGLGGGGGSGGSSCGTPSPPGRPGYVQNGSAGSGASDRDGFLTNGYWWARSGGSGGLGQHGGGGGGGGGSGGCDIGTDSYGAGGGGGGAGGCRASSAGGGGGGGGGSFGLFAVSSTVNASSCTITRGTAGQGGPGGAGGHGQRGGLPGPGGLANGDSKAGGAGGAGAHGGHGGGGGGGAGGLSVGVFIYQSTVNQTCTINGGSSGSGGGGGVSAPNAPTADKDGNNGTGGISGAVRAVDTCAGASSC